MKIVLIGSSQYREKFERVRDRLESEGHDVRIPAFDSQPSFDDIGVCAHNRSLIEWADEVHVIWDQRSTGTIFDFGMCFMARKPLVIEYMEEKTFRGVMEKYAAVSIKTA
jgi:diphthamide synthase subunit DPH2